MRRQKHATSFVGELPQEIANPDHSVRIEPIDRLVQNQMLGVAQQGYSKA